MATGKRYYWIKLKETFMTSDSVDFLMSQPNGANYVVLYQMLCLKTINTDGKLTRQIGEVIIPYDIAKIERDTKWFNQDTIRVALELYKSLGLIYQDTDGTLVMTDHKNLVGSETDYAQQKKMQRENKLLLEGVDSGVDNVHTDIRDKILDIRDKRIDIKIKNIIPPTVEMVREYCQERNNGINPEEFCDFYTSKGWKVGKEKMKDWQACVRTWEKSRANKKPDRYSFIDDF